MCMKLTTIPLAGADPIMHILATFDLVLSALSIILGRDQLLLSNGAECSPVLDMLNLVAHWSTPREREVRPGFRVELAALCEVEMPRYSITSKRTFR